MYIKQVIIYKFDLGNLLLSTGDFTNEGAYYSSKPMKIFVYPIKIYSIQNSTELQKPHLAKVSKVSILLLGTLISPLVLKINSSSEQSKIMYSKNSSALYSVLHSFSEDNFSVIVRIQTVPVPSITRTSIYSNVIIRGVVALRFVLMQIMKTESYEQHRICSIHKKIRHCHVADLIFT